MWHVFEKKKKNNRTIYGVWYMKKGEQFYDHYCGTGVIL